LRLSFISLFFLFFIIEGCGYKPTTNYTTPIMGQKIYPEVEIDIQNPIDSLFLKDALNEAIIGVFNSEIGTATDYNSKLSLNVGSVSISAIDYDKNGYPVLYRAKASIVAMLQDSKGDVSSYSAVGSYDFSINNSAVLSDDIKHNAIKEAFIKALQLIEFKIAQKGMSRDDNKSDS